MTHVLAIDLGTSGPKVGLVCVDGTIADSESTITPMLLGPHGAAEQDPGEWWTAITGAVRRLMARGAVDRTAVSAIAVTAHWSGTVPVGAGGRHLMNAMLWMDSRGAAQVRDLTTGPVRIRGYGVPSIYWYLTRAGGLPRHTGRDPAAHIAWIRHNRPEVYAATTVFLEPADYLNLQLTGRACSSYECIALHWVTDNRDLETVHYDDRLLRLTKIERDRLPELVPPATIVGGLLPSVAHEWGLTTGTPVATASGDMPSAIVGSGAIADYEPHLYIGTSSRLSCHVPRKRTDLLGNQTTLPAALPGRYFIANIQETAGASLTFLKDTLRLRPDGWSDDGGSPELFAAYDQIVAATPTGAGKVIFTPWLNGQRTPVDDATVRAGYHNLSLTTTTGDLVRAVYEGVAFNSRWLLEAVERFVGHRLPALTFIGGGARSVVWAQIHADVLDRPIRQVAQPELANMRGAAFIALVALKYAEPEQLTQRVTIIREFEPRARHRSQYDDLYGSFRKIYRQTRRIYSSLNGGPS
jgi:xylulokinase